MTITVAPVVRPAGPSRPCSVVITDDSTIDGLTRLVKTPVAVPIENDRVTGGAGL